MKSREEDTWRGNHGKETEIRLVLVGWDVEGGFVRCLGCRMAMELLPPWAVETT
jgi:hypothetical protein